MIGTTVYRLREARNQIGWTQAEVAEKIGVSREYLSMLESGKRRPSLRVLKRLAELYGVPVSWFYGIREPTGTFQLLLRQTGNLSPESRQAIQYFCVLCDEIAHLRSLLNIPTEIPPAYPVTRDSIEEQARHAAMMERARLGLDDDPVPHLIEVLESKGIAVIQLKMPQDEVSGAMAYDAEKGGFILVNAADPPPRRLWTVAHEYGHLIKDRERGFVPPELVQEGNGLRGQRFEGKPSYIEWFAHQFAAHFLMPEETVRRLLSDMWHGRIDVRSLMGLRRTFGVSYHALLLRLRNLKIISDKEYQHWREERLRRFWDFERLLYGFGSDIRMGREEPSVPSGLLRDLALEATRRGEISMSYCAELLGISPMEVQDLIAYLEETTSDV